MKLTQMQDIGGCRSVLSSAREVRDVESYYLNESRIKHALVSHDNYIKNPRESGYRGVHLVYRYFSDSEATETYNGLKIEMQLRSPFQHAWATAVETVGTFVREALKSSIGSEDWLRFFALMGSVISARENAPFVPGTPQNERELVGELREYASKLNVGRRLRAYGEALKSLQGDTQNASWYLLELNPAETKLTITGFKKRELDLAVVRYSESETRVKDHAGTDAVLVSVDSVAALPRAYPNYFADTRVFVDLMNQALSGQRRVIQAKPIKLGS